MPVDPHAALAVVQDVFDRVSSDLSMLTDRSIEVASVTFEQRSDRPVGAACTHLSFRFGVHSDGGVGHGTMLVPLPLSIALSSYLMMMPDDQVAELVQQPRPDGPTKEAMLEVGNFIASAVDAALHAAELPCKRVVFEGCQGVHADVRPQLEYVEGAPLGVGRAMMEMASMEPVETILIVPEPALAA